MALIIPGDALENPHGLSLAEWANCRLKVLSDNTRADVFDYIERFQNPKQP